MILACNSFRLWFIFVCIYVFPTLVFPIISEATENSPSKQFKVVMKDDIYTPSSHFKLCQRLEEILRDPINHYVVEAKSMRIEDHPPGYSFNVLEFHIPESHKQYFRLPKWQEVPETEWETALGEGHPVLTSLRTGRLDYTEVSPHLYRARMDLNFSGQAEDVFLVKTRKGTARIPYITVATNNEEYIHSYENGQQILDWRQLQKGTFGWPFWHEGRVYLMIGSFARLQEHKGQMQRIRFHLHVRETSSSDRRDQSLNGAKLVCILREQEINQFENQSKEK